MLSDPLSDLPSSIRASLPSYLVTDSSSGDTANYDVNENQDPMEEDMHVDGSDLSDLSSDYGDSDTDVNRKSCWLYDQTEEITPELQEVLDKYLEQVEESEGFEFTDYPGPIEGTTVMPYAYDERFDYRLADFAIAAIDDYNKQNHTKYKFVKINKVNIEEYGVAEIKYLNFDAVMDGSAGESVQKTFQAKVVYDITNGKLEIDLCRVAKSA